MNIDNSSQTKYWILITLFLAGLILSGIHPHDYFTWILEVFPALIGCTILIFTFHKFRFTDFAYILILIHCSILFIGGHYTYAEVPLFNWLKEVFHQSRNNYDKLGHFAQGCIPAILVRELFIRREIVRVKSWLPFLTICVCVGMSAFYEFLEWFVAVLSGASSDSFLGTQGYIWDTQSDMFFAFLGALCTILFLSRLHDKHIQNMTAQHMR